MKQAARTVGRLFLRLLLVTLVPVCVGAVIYGTFAVIGTFSDAICWGLSQAWNFVASNWLAAAIVAVVIFITIVIVEIISNKRK